MQRFAECFEDLPDPRADNALHDLTEILFIALMATLCGATSCTDMALFARMKAYLWQDVLELKNGLPSHDTFSRVFRMLDPKAFEVAFRRFMTAFAQGAKMGQHGGGALHVGGKNSEELVASVHAVATLAESQDLDGVCRTSARRGRPDSLEGVLLIRRAHRGNDALRNDRAHC